MPSEPTEPQPCHYEFVWRSVLGCPVCSEHDMGYFITSCIEPEDGSTPYRRQIFYWLQNPKRCHDGVPLKVSTPRSPAFPLRFARAS
jgi:hypothetical protein